jgi:hypothetical protein
MTKKAKKKVVKKKLDEKTLLIIKVLESKKIMKSDLDLIFSMVKKYEAQDGKS